jgi:hypothetical protein
MAENVKINLSNGQKKNVPIVLSNSSLNHHSGMTNIGVPHGILQEFINTR